MTDPRAWCDQVDGRTNAATDGPWEPTRHGVETVPPDDLHRFDIMAEQVARTDFTVDAEFIAHARTDLPAATKKLRAVLDLHAPRPYDTIRDGVSFGQTEYPDLCAECRSTYPCPTITTLEDA